MTVEIFKILEMLKIVLKNSFTKQDRDNSDGKYERKIVTEDKSRRPRKREQGKEGEKRKVSNKYLRFKIIS